MLDPRLAATQARLADVQRVVAVTGGKGGVGKSLVAASLALVLAREGEKVGLLDLDLTSPSAHVILGFPAGFPEEGWGIDPPLHEGVACLSVAQLAPDVPAPLRGADVSNAVLELLAVARWGTLDHLVVDMPPGLGDAMLDAMRLLPRAEYLVVAGSSRVVLASVRRTLGLLLEQRRPVIGVLENMRRGATDAVEALAREAGVPYLGALPWDAGVEAALGDADRLAATEAVEALRVALARARSPS